MEELIRVIYRITVEMGQLLQEKSEEGFLDLLTQRSALMEKVDSLKRELLDFKYTPIEIKLLEEIIAMDQSYNPVLAERIAVTQAQLNQAKKVKVASNKYRPYIKQISGAFIDSTK